MYTQKVDRDNYKDSKKPEINNDKFITAFVDGSFCPETKSWGIGAWVRMGSKKGITFSLSGSEGINSTEVELIGLNEIKKFLLDQDINEKIIVIQCDNISALEKFNFKELKYNGAQFVKLKHVKAHNNSGSKRSYVNNLVDKLAKSAMRSIRGY